jgi:uroporphyrinogen decarboxylase
MAARLDVGDFRMLRTMVERFGKDKYHLQSINGPFQEGWLVRGGMDKAFLDMAADPEMAHLVGRITTDFNKAVIDISHEIGADGVVLDGDLTGNDFMLMSMEHYREFIKPYKKEIVDHAHGKGMRVVKHSDGNMWALMDELIEIGFDGFHPVQPQCMDIGQVNAFLEGRLCMFGNVDCLDLLVFGTPEKTAAATRDCIRKGSPGGAHVLCSSNSLHPGVRPENALAMFRAAKKYGDYGDIPNEALVKREDLNLDKLAKKPTRGRERKRERQRAVA